MQVILGLGSGNLVYLEVGPGSIQQAGHLQLQAELACLDITPLGEDPDRAQIAVAGEAVKYRAGHCFVAWSPPLLPATAEWDASIGQRHALQCRGGMPSVSSITVRHPVCSMCMPCCMPSAWHALWGALHCPVQCCAASKDLDVCYASILATGLSSSELKPESFA